MTPEGKVKQWIDTLLESFSTHRPLWWFKPVQSGYGKRALDYIGCCNGKFFGVEAKEPGKYPTPYQRITMREMYYSGAAVFSISTIEGVAAFGRWLKKQ